MEQYSKLIGIANTQNASITNILLQNFLSFYDWGFLDKGGYYNINIPSSGAYGGDKHRLRPVQDPNYVAGKTWQGYRNNWVWETGVSVGTPNNISGIYVDSVFQDTGYKIDHKNGKVEFDTPIGITSNVQLQHSQKWLNVVPAKGVPWFREIQKRSNRLEESFASYGSGNYAQLGKTRVPLPCLAINVLTISETNGYQLGGGKTAENQIVFSVLAEHDWECSNILDTICMQGDRNIYLFDPNEMASSGVSVFNYDNTLTDFGSASGTHPQLVEAFKYNEPCYIHDSRSEDPVELSPNLYMGTARCKTNIRITSQNDY